MEGHWPQPTEEKVSRHCHCPCPCLVPLLALLTPLLLVLLAMLLLIMWALLGSCWLPTSCTLQCTDIPAAHACCHYAAACFTECRPVWCIEAETFDDNDRARIMCYTGFVYKYKTQQAGQPSLQWYTQVSGLQPLMLCLQLSEYICACIMPAAALADGVCVLPDWGEGGRAGDMLLC